MPKPFHPSAHEGGTLHHYAPSLVAYEHAAPPSAAAGAAPSPVSTIVFIGGIGDGLLTVPYSAQLAPLLPAGWRLLQPLLRSSYNGWGTSSLDEDVASLARLVEYLRERRPTGRIVFLGHSTGCQDTMHYLTAPDPEPDGQPGTKRAPIDGAILQAPVSDREGLWALGDMSAEITKGETLAREWVNEGRGDDVLPREHTMYVFGQRAAVSAQRFLDLTSPGPEHAGADDYFSSDLGLERLQKTFGRVGAAGAPRVLLLMGGSDEYVPDHVQLEPMVGKWMACLKEGGAVVDGGSCVIEGADHGLKTCGDEVREGIFKRILDFLVNL